jgi:hypothetical protein
MVAASEIHQDLPHQLGRDREEMRPVLPGGIGIDQPQVSLIDKSGGLQGVARVLEAHVAMSQPM